VDKYPKNGLSGHQQAFSSVPGTVLDYCNVAPQEITTQAVARRCILSSVTESLVCLWLQLVDIICQGELLNRIGSLTHSVWRVGYTRHACLPPQPGGGFTRRLFPPQLLAQSDLGS
ncbi:hypothetical protein J6590_104738, partial [Homalodisca vitripennis]